VSIYPDIFNFVEVPYSLPVFLTLATGEHQVHQSIKQPTVPPPPPPIGLLFLDTGKSWTTVARVRNRSRCCFFRVTILLGHFQARSLWPRQQAPASQHQAHGPHITLGFEGPRKPPHLALGQAHRSSRPRTRSRTVICCQRRNLMMALQPKILQS
jgi:hypothetical protein